MIMSFGRTIAKARGRAPARSRTLSFSGFPLGLNTSVPPFMINQKEVSECVNYKIKPGGQFETRAPILVYTSSAFGNIPRFMIKAFVGSTERELVVDDDYVLYYLNSGAPTIIATLEGEATLLPYKSVVLCLDGSYIKYLDGIASTNLKIAYDDGTGTNGYQFDNSAGDNDSSLALGNGTNTRISYKFTSQAWDAGYRIPFTTVTAKLQREGNGFTGSDNVDITVSIRRVADDVASASKTFREAPIATNVANTATEYSVTFAAADITTEMDPSTAYYVSLEYNNGNATNYVHVRTTTVTSAGKGYSYAGAWAQSTTNDPIMSLRPGRPPKGKFGCIHNDGPFISGDPDNPAYVWFGNGTYLDWSTSNGGGYVGMRNASGTSFPVGALLPLYNDLYVWGQENQPAIAKLTGSTPSSFALPSLFQKGWATHKTLVPTGNDLWTAARDGVDPLSGVQEYGDVRTFSASDSIKDKFEDYWNTANSTAGYYPPDGHYMLSFPTYRRILIFPTKNPVRYLGRPRYPISEYELYKAEYTASAFKWTASASGTNEYYVQTSAGADPSISTQPDFITMDGDQLTEGTMGSLDDHQWDYGDNDSLGYSTVYVRDDSGDPDTTGVVIRSIIIPRCFAYFDGYLYFGASDKHIYRLDSSDYKDLSEYHLRPKLKSAYIELPFGYGNLNQYQLLMNSRAGAGLTIDIYKDGLEETPSISNSHNLPMSDSLTLADLDMDLGDASFAISPSQTVIWKRINLNVRSFQIGIRSVTVLDKPLFINGLILKYRPLEI